MTTNTWFCSKALAALTAVSLRLESPFFMGSGLTYLEASNCLGWNCWLPNLLFAEWVIRRGRVSSV